MNRFLRHLKLRQQILLSKLLPSLALALIIAFSVYNEWNTYQEQSKSNRLYHVASLLSDAVHALQNERELSTTYIAENNSYLLERLNKQRRFVDSLMIDLRYLDRNPLLRGLFPRAHNRIYFDDELLASIEKTRTHLTDNDSRYLEEYTVIIRKILRLFSSKAMLTNDPELTYYVIALTKILWVQEYAGTEKAIISQAISRNSINAEGYVLFRELAHLQTRLIEDFLAISGIDTQHEQLLKAQDDISFATIDNMREHIVSVRINNEFRFVEALQEQRDPLASWLSASEDRITLIQMISQDIIKHIILYTEDKKDNALWSMLAYLFAGLLILILSSLISYLVNRRFIGGIDSAIDSIETYHKEGVFKEFDITLGHDEISKLATTFNHLIRDKNVSHTKLALSDMVFKTASEGILVLDSNKKVISSNEAMLKLCGHDSAICEGQLIEDLDELNRQNNPIDFSSIWDDLDANGQWQGEFWIDNQKGTPSTPTLCNITTLRDDEGAILNYIVIMADISDIKKSQEKVEFQATHDMLTKLPNRTYFTIFMEEQLKQHKRQNKQLAVLFMDLDDFKYVNDSLGHNVGDEVLKITAKRLQDCLRDEDLIARQGGDEFLVILPEIQSVNDVAHIAENIIKRIKQPMNIDDKEIRISISVGISQFPVDSGDLDILISNADMAMYQAKKDGSSNYSFFTSSINDEVKRRFELEGELWKALENEEFFIAYQPKIDIASGGVMGAEALIRWQHPTKGLIPPIEFIAIAEASGIIQRIGDFVIEESIKLAKQLQLSVEYPAPIAINISPLQFRTGNIADKFRTLLEQHDLSSEFIQIEITETVLIKGDQNVVDTLNELSNMGIKIAIDDFGTGYSSLSYLKEFPIDIVKIDSSFIFDLFVDDDNQVLVNTIINMAKGLKKSLVAEGVEEQEHADWLFEHGCDVAQGFLYSKPLAEKEFLAYLNASNKVVHIMQSKKMDGS